MCAIAIFIGVYYNYMYWLVAKLNVPPCYNMIRWIAADVSINTQVSLTCNLIILEHCDIVWKTVDLVSKNTRMSKCASSLRQLLFLAIEKPCSNS